MTVDVIAKLAPKNDAFTGLVDDDQVVFADNTDGNASTSKHGYLKKLSNVSTEFMNGQGNWATPAGGGGGGDKYPFEARLTLEYNVPFSITAQTAKTKIYLTPYNGNQIAVYDGSSAWETLELSDDIDASLAGLTANLPYDVFVYNNSGTLTLELLAWTNTTTRATAITTQDGVDVKTGATTRRLAGTILITATTAQCEVSPTFCGISNRYNEMDFPLFANPGYNDNNTNTTYTTTSATWVEANSGTGSRVTWIACKAKPILANLFVAGYGASGGYGAVAVGFDTTTQPNSESFTPVAAQNFFTSHSDNNKGVPLAAGSHYAALLVSYFAVSPFTIYADFGSARQGASTDPAGTSVSITIQM